MKKIMVVELLFLSAHVFNLLILDLMLPGLSWEEVLTKMIGIPVIVVSAKTDMNDKIQILLRGASD